ncbi:MAG: hypothetical protein IT176_07360 [Acidobacteria bacterium]|nr:hypothetical protein [Acidobacteriota bacterium]
MSPILVRPVREQLEHDRIIRQLQARHKRKYEVGINPGSEHNAPVGTGVAALYPDLVLQSQERGRKLQAVIEVETGESVNHLEALAQWAHLSRLRAPFHLYVPAGMVEVARRLSEDNRIPISEIWSYHAIGDEMRFTLVHRAREATPVPAKSKGGPSVRPSPSHNGARPARKAAAREPKAAARPRAARGATPAKAKPSKKAKRK